MAATEVNEQEQLQLLSTPQEGPPQKRMSIPLAIISVVCTLYGNGCCIVALNWWLKTFPSNAGATFSVQLVSGIFYLICFLLALVAFTIRYGRQALWKTFTAPPSHELSSSSEDGADPAPGSTTSAMPQRTTGQIVRRRLKLLAIMGLTDVGSNLIAIFATPHTPEILQAFLYTTIAPWALLESYVFVPSERQKSYRSWLLWVSIFLIISSVVFSAVPLNDLAHLHIKAKYTVDKTSFVCWILVYASSAVVYGAWSVVQRIYCDDAYMGPSSAALEGVDRETEGESLVVSSKKNKSLRGSGINSSSSSSSSPIEIAVVGSAQQNGDTSGHDDVPWEVGNKLGMLLGDSLFQLVFTFLLLPCDAIPWLGSSATIADTWSRLVLGLKFLLNSTDSVLFGVLYCTGYMISYIGSAILNHYNPTLSCMMVQLSAPLTAVILLVIPSWNVNSGGQVVVWYQQTVAIIAITASAFTFHRWLKKHG